MAKSIKYYIVAADALPEIFIKVAEAKTHDADRRSIHGTVLGCNSDCI